MNFHALNFWTRVGTSLALVAALAACGGSDGDSVTPPPPAPVTVSLYAGSLQSAGGADGAGAAAQFNRPTDVAQDAQGNVYVADFANAAVRRIGADGRVTTFAGAAGQTGAADGAGSAARFAGPFGVAADSTGNVYVSDAPNKTLRKISPAGVVTTIAGIAGQSGFIDGDAATARLGSPGSLAVDPNGTIYFVDGLSVRKRAPDGTISTFAGNPNESGSMAFGSAAQTRFISTLIAVAVDGSGNVYVSEGSSRISTPIGIIRKFDPQGRAVALGSAADGVLGISYPSDISVDAAGTMYVLSNGADQNGRFLTIYRTLVRITPDGMTSTFIAGDNQIRTVDGPLATSRFTDPTSVAVGPAGRIIVGETSTNAIRLVDTQAGTVTTFAGGDGGGDVDGAVANARFNVPLGIAAAPDGTLFVADSLNRSVRKIAAGVMSTLNRTGAFPQEVAASTPGGPVYEVSSASGSGELTVASIAAGGAIQEVPGLSGSRTVAVDAAGNLYGSDGSDVFVVSTAGAKRVLASGISANDLAVDAAGNVYFTSAFQTVGVIDPTGKTVILAGRPNESGSVDGTGQDARFSAPGAVAIDAGGSTYVADGTRIRKVSPQGTVTTIADITHVQGAAAGFDAASLKSVKGLAWSGGALYATVLNAVIRITL